MSLLNFFHGRRIVAATASEKKWSQEADTSQQQKRVAYEKDKRQRSFQNHWLTEYSWLQYDADEDRMWCGVRIERPGLAECKSPMFIKPDRFRKDTLRLHDNTSYVWMTLKKQVVPFLLIRQFLADSS